MHGEDASWRLLSLPLESDRPGCARLQLAHIAPFNGPKEVLGQAASTSVSIGDPFEYVDIGAGVPSSDLPAEALARVA